MPTIGGHNTKVIITHARQFRSADRMSILRPLVGACHAGWRESLGYYCEGFRMPAP